MSGSKARGIKRIINAVFYSLQGLRDCFYKEAAFRQETFFALVLIPLGLWIGDTWPQRFFLAGSVFFVLIIELLNAAIERAIDRISFERHELSKEAKDMGSAAVFLAIIQAVIVWVVILVHQFLQIF